jgi:hypothetical protein
MIGDPIDNSLEKAVEEIKTHILTASIEISSTDGFAINFYCEDNWYQLSKSWFYSLGRVDIITKNGMIEFTNMRGVGLDESRSIQELFYVMEDQFKMPLDEITSGRWKHIFE